MLKVLNCFFILSFFYISIDKIQAQTLTREDVKKAINYFNCKLVEGSLNKEEESLNAFKSKCDCNKYPSFENIINSIDKNFTATVDLSKEIDNITNMEEIKDTAELIKLLTESIFSEKIKYKKIVKFSNDNSAQLSKIKADLLRTFQDPSFFSDSPIRVEINENKTANENETKNEQTAESGWFSGFSSQMIVISLLFSFIVSLIFFIISRIQLNNLNQQLSEINKIIDREKNNNHVKNDEGTNDEYTKLLKQLEPVFNKKIVQLQSDLKNDIKELKINFEKSFETIKKSEPNPVISQFSPPKDTNRTTFYLTMPEGEKTFSNQTKHLKLESGRSIYEAIEINSTKAKFRICNNQDSINRALNNLDKCIKTVCDELNPPDGATKIITDINGEGIIELQNDKWVVITKARIRYEI